MNDEQLLTLHRQWIWASRIKHDFVETLKPFLKSRNHPEVKELFTPYWAYMYIWYGLLFSILEVIKKTRVFIPAIDSEMKSIYVSLKACRNAVVHPQPRYWSSKLFKIMEDAGSAKKIWKVHDGLGKYFLEELDRRQRSPNPRS